MPLELEPSCRVAREIRLHRNTLAGLEPGALEGRKPISVQHCA